MVYTGIGAVTDVENRIRALDSKLRSLEQANPQASVFRGQERLPAPENPTLTKGLGVIHFRWDAVSLPDLATYEIEVADNAAFTEPVTVKTRDTSWNYSTGVIDQTYRARVRVISNSRRAGPWSKVQTIAKDNVVDNDLELLAVETGRIADQAIHDYGEGSGASIDLGSSASDSQIFATSVTVETGVVFVIFDFTANGDGASTGDYQVYPARDGTQLIDTLFVDADAVLSESLFIFDNPGAAGTYEYSIELTDALGAADHGTAEAQITAWTIKK